MCVCVYSRLIHTVLKRPFVLPVIPLRKPRITADTDTEELAKPRVVRVFISSTFLDMQAERDALVKVLSPLGLWRI